MIIVTGGAGFIGSAMVHQLNKNGNDNIYIVDELGLESKWKNLTGLKFADFINKNDFINKIKDGYRFGSSAIIHMGANSSTTEKDADHLIENNYEYTKELAHYSVKNNVRFVYASSAATYGDGDNGFIDNEAKLEELRPLNMYGYSKHLFDLYAKRNNLLDKIVGVKFFNVFGPNEYHKGDMRSVVNKAYYQILETGKVKLFKSKHPEYRDGEQLRDFIYVKDAVNMTLFFLENPEVNGIFNLGTGKSRSWNDLVKAIFASLNQDPNIEYIDMPEILSAKYQYYTKADNSKIIKAGYKHRIHTLEEGVKDYVTHYLQDKLYLGY